jgi:hypothetical protein
MLGYVFGSLRLVCCDFGRQAGLGIERPSPFEVAHCDYDVIDPAKHCERMRAGSSGAHLSAC